MLHLVGWKIWIASPKAHFNLSSQINLIKSIIIRSAFLHNLYEILVYADKSRRLENVT